MPQCQKKNLLSHSKFHRNAQHKSVLIGFKFVTGFLTAKRFTIYFLKVVVSNLSYMFWLLWWFCLSHFRCQYILPKLKARFDFLNKHILCYDLHNKITYTSYLYSITFFKRTTVKLFICWFLSLYSYSIVKVYLCFIT